MLTIEFRIGAVHMDTEPLKLITAMHHLKVLVSQLKPQGEMTFGEFCVMSMIDKETYPTNRKLTPTRLNELLGTKKPATSRMLTVLEKKGFVVKSCDEFDHRMSYLELSKLGSQVLSQEREEFHKLVDRISNRLGNDEIEQITTTLLHLSDILEEEIEVATKW
jgi:DNA-binding MarR family transcriptional regulator